MRRASHSERPIPSDIVDRVAGDSFLPRLLLCRPARGCKVSREKLTARLENFRHGRRVTRRRCCPEDDNGEEWMTGEVHEHQKVCNGCGLWGQLFAKRNEKYKSVVWLILVTTQKKDPSVRCQFRRAKNHAMNRLDQGLRDKQKTTLRRTREATVGRRFRGMMCGMVKHLSKLRKY